MIPSMEQPLTPAMYRLPPELLLQIARNLCPREPAYKLVHLRNLCQVSKKLCLIAQEEFYANAILPISCGCHPTVNAALQLLRTLLERPALARNVKVLRLTVVRRSISTLYCEKRHQRPFDFPTFRELCLAKLTTLGYGAGHPWWASLQHDVESAYAGLLLCVLPNLQDLQCTIRELHRGCNVMNSFSALYGTCDPPAALAVTLKKTLQALCTPDTNFLRTMHFENLNVLRLPSISILTLLELNGPNTFWGTAQLSELYVGLPIRIMDKDSMHEFEVCFRDLLNALGCRTLSILKLRLFNEGYCVVQDPGLDVQYFVNQLSFVERTLKILEIELNPDEGPQEWEWILSHCENPVSSLMNFAHMESLTIPQGFLFEEEVLVKTLSLQILPKKLQCFTVDSPTKEFLTFAEGILKSPDDFHDLRKIILRCRDGPTRALSTFSKIPDPLWQALFVKCGIRSYAYDVDTKKLKRLGHYDDVLSIDGEDFWEDTSDDISSEDDDHDDEMEDNNNEDSDDYDSSMPDLEAVIMQANNQLGTIVDDME
ncbi:hypothetical protein N0V90_001514 [Kalmusia sp. IMI 367209]|nr:hypothetical protein N0V90_001514 [Kalmusia sp. IMI 367209]